MKRNSRSSNWLILEAEVNKGHSAWSGMIAMTCNTMTFHLQYLRGTHCLTQILVLPC